MTYRMENQSSRFISTEIEVAGVRSQSNTNTYKVVRKWKGAIVSDGSVGSGFEINTAPSAGDVFIAQIREICDALEEDGAFATQAAGAHVHVDARDFTFYDMRRLIFLYEKIEDTLYGLVSPHRRSGGYSAPCGQLYSRNLRAGLVPKESKKVLLRNMYELSDVNMRQVQELKRGKGWSKRYHGLNLHSWMHRGTIECRIMHGSTDPEKLIRWGVLWAAILDYAMKNTEASIERLPKGEGLGILFAIAQSDELKQWIENRWAFFHRTRR